jgi:SAM-dependent methyltransferase
MKQEEQFFDFAAEVGLTKHLGGLEGTETLVELCHIEGGSRVLDVGCGVGQTAVHLATQIGCHVTGVDILPRMVERSEERARRAGVADLTTFRVADAQDLPFDDETFDTSSRPISVKAEGQGIIRRYGRLGIARVLGRTLGLYLRNPNYRAFVKRVRSQGVVPDGLTDYFGYGLYVGRK